MFERNNLQIFWMLLSLIALTLQVDITLTAIGYDHYIGAVEFRFDDASPGVCCSPPWPSLPAGLILAVRFDHLFAWNIAAVWGVIVPGEHTPENDNCRGTVGATRTGPGTWSWEVVNQRERHHLAARGASYIALPSILPPDPSDTIYVENLDPLNDYLSLSKKSPINTSPKMKLSPTLASLASVFQIPIHPRLASAPTTTRAPFSTSASALARQTQRPKVDKRISKTSPKPLPSSPPSPKTQPLTNYHPPSQSTALIRYHLHHPKTPRPLRFSRLRALRHWTIHRAAQLYLHSQRRKEQLELERQYNAMRAACEELRVGVEDGGRLYRQATTRKGLWGGLKMEGEIVGNGGVPIEYARAQVEGPPRGGWDHGWTR
ncbi:MAG: hypothetical protein Q9219_006741 [cf. Caloplaca sp. 3 TL-2023]